MPLQLRDEGAFLIVAFANSWRSENLTRLKFRLFQVIRQRVRQAVETLRPIKTYGLEPPFGFHGEGVAVGRGFNEVVHLFDAAIGDWRENGCRSTSLLVLTVKHVPIDQERNHRAKDDLVEMLGRRRCFALTGAGVSRWAGYPLWDEVLTRLADRVRDHRGNEVNIAEIQARTHNKLLLAAKLSEALGDARFSDFLENEFSLPAQRPHPVVSTIARLPFLHFLTLNFDLSLESAVQPPLRALSTADLRRLWAFLHECTTCERTVVHLHGRYNDSLDRIALTEHVYSELYHHQGLRHFLWPIMAAHQVLFLGCGFQDVDFNNVLIEFRRVLEGHTRFPHFAIVGLKPNENDAQERTRLREELLIEPVFYDVTVNNGQEIHDEFAQVVDEISTALGLAKLQPPIIEPPTQLPDQNDLRRAEQLRERLLQQAEADQ